MKHTKGEWRISDICPYSVIAGGKIPNQTDIACTNMHDTIKLFANMPTNKEEAEANAKLISAAPELLEALKEMCKLAERLQDWIAKEKPIIMGKEAFKKRGYSPSYDKAQDAIQKATTI